ncbi:MAG: 30S ribosomal protein S6 [Candidatus Marinimicrobia bacterium]|jgi:small subunit ribosomal protein S6|nr:30S ribosomal protein S6 [Candidatus Neomarinimicrobiota bacterium]MBT3947763.1 30S ribosomal protein S6 [Candidatus Neomarinimicrobiota bacterium]MBT4064611.1 30S ribosomal protein S6 [Candidatus Neomarinimicrobiota bacterium]MBT4307653.1 30S ribosomal protein S6 [Candidatus Neomarinimicrobiota bacterium]MBT4453577.1 30S ribosomal protein S6 [Candidatus Neomarinimicrobiota bacterium]
MRYYESLYIVNPNYEQERLDEVMKTVFDKIGEYGFSMINHHVWGKKRLAYAIQKHKYGSFILLHFETESVENLDRFQRFMVLEKPILRNQTVVLEARPEVQVVEEIVDESEEAVVSDTGSDNSEEKKPKEEVVETTAIETEEPSEEIVEEATIEEEPVEKETSEDTKVKDEVEEKVEIQE